MPRENKYKIPICLVYCFNLKLEVTVIAVKSPKTYKLYLSDQDVYSRGYSDWRRGRRKFGKLDTSSKIVVYVFKSHCFLHLEKSCLFPKLMPLL